MPTAVQTRGMKVVSVPTVVPAQAPPVAADVPAADCHVPCLTDVPDNFPVPGALAADFDFVSDKDIGRGTYARIRLLRKKGTGEQFALKIMEKEPLRQLGILQRAYREVSLHSPALLHNNIVRSFGHTEDDRYLYLLLEFAPMGSLRSLALRFSGRRMPERVVQKVLRQVCECLGCLHGYGIVHRDLKLENLLLFSEGAKLHVKLSDFGWGALVKDRPRGLCGTPECCPPEVLAAVTSPPGSGPAQGPAVDIWQVGILAYTMLVGSPPFGVPDPRWGECKDPHFLNRVMTGQFSFPPGFSEGAQTFVTRCLQAEVGRRGTASELLEWGWLQETVLPPPMPAVPRAQLPGRSQPKSPAKPKPVKPKPATKSLVSKPPLVEGGRWDYICMSVNGMDLRETPTLTDNGFHGSVGFGESIMVKVRLRTEGMVFLECADGRGWVAATEGPGSDGSMVNVKSDRGVWVYQVVCEEDVELRAGPTYDDDARTGLVLHCGDQITVYERVEMYGVRYLKLGEGLGWVFERKGGTLVMAEMDADAEDLEYGYWHYMVVAQDCVEIRDLPTSDDISRTGQIVYPSDCLTFSARCYIHGVLYLKLHDGRGWLFETKDDMLVLAELPDPSARPPQDPSVRGQFYTPAQDEAMEGSAGQQLARQLLRDLRQKHGSDGRFNLHRALAAELASVDGGTGSSTGDGSLGIAQLARFVESIGGCSWPRDDVAELFQFLDMDQTGSISKFELLYGLEQAPRQLGSVSGVDTMAIAKNRR